MTALILGAILLVLVWAALNLNAIATPNMGDLLLSYWPNIGKNAWTDLSTDLQEFVFYAMVNDSGKVDKEGGPTFGWNCSGTFNDNFESFLPFQTDKPSGKDTMFRATRGYWHGRSNYPMDEDVVAMYESAPDKIFDMVLQGDSQAKMALANGVETRFLYLPSTNANSPEQFCGIPYWIAYGTGTNVDSTTGGFWGANPTGFNDCAGIDATGAGGRTRWCNYCDTYVAISKDDLVTRLRRGAYKTHFTSPLVPKPADYSKPKTRFYYAPFTICDGLAIFSEQQNDNLGKELAPYNSVTINGNAFIPVPSMDPEQSPPYAIGTTGPILGIDWSEFRIATFRDPANVVTREQPVRMGDAHSVWVNWYKISAQLKCTNRRKQQLYATGAPW